MTVTDLARVLGVTQQAASKQVADLERRGLVRRRDDPEDGRARLVELSDAGRLAVEAASGSRRATADEVAAALGQERAAELLAGLAELSELLGAADVMAGRRLRPEAER
jgi:DNA-binding MarR family transcriptional regulator